MRWIISLLLMLMGPAAALAQQQAPPPAGNFWYDNTASPPLWRPASTAYPFPISGSFTANLNGFAPSLSYATCSSTGSSCASTAIPTNTGSVVLFNSGTTAVSCTVASGAATALTNEIQIPASSGIALATVYGATTYDHFACIDQSGSASNVVIASGGSGLPTGWGGGGSGGSGGAVTIASGGVASGAYAAGSIASGAMVDLGSQADSACSTDDGSCSLVALQKRGNQNLTTLNTTAGSSLPPGSALIGQVSLNIAAAANSATNGAYFNLLQGNAVIASGNPIFSQGTTSTAHIGNVDPNTAANWGLGATGAAAPANSVFVGATTGGATGGYMQGLVTCNSHTFVHITSATDTVLVQGTASQSIYSCGWRARAAGVATWYIEDEADANNNCSNLGSQLTGIATEAANTGEVAKSPFWDGFKGTSGHGFCIKSTGTGGVDIDFWYTKF